MSGGVDLTMQEAAALWVVVTEIPRDLVVDAVQLIQTRNNLPPDAANKIAEAYVRALNKLSDHVKPTPENMRSLWTVVEGDKT